MRSHLVESEPGKKTFETVNELVDHMRVDHDTCLECLKVEDGAKSLGANARNTSKLKETVLKRDNKSRLRRC